MGGGCVLTLGDLVSGYLFMKLQSLNRAWACSDSTSTLCRSRVCWLQSLNRAWACSDVQPLSISYPRCSCNPSIGRGPVLTGQDYHIVDKAGLLQSPNRAGACAVS